MYEALLAHANLSNAEVALTEHLAEMGPLHDMEACDRCGELSLDTV